MSERRPIVPGLIALALAAVLGACSANNDTVTPVDIPAASMAYVVLAWSETGMHMMNPTFDAAVYGLPYNTIIAQVVKRGSPPEIVTTGVTLEYRIVDNTYSYGKASTTPVRTYAQFWDNSLELFGFDLAHDTGLNFTDPDVHNGLTGTMLLKGDRFEATGVPVVPMNDAGTWDPYQVAEVVVKNASTGAELARTRAVVQTSDEINCAKCHGKTIKDVEVGSVLEEHDEGTSTTFVEDGVPINCGECHGSLALGAAGEGSAEEYLSYAVHVFHYNQSGVACYDCHPGATTLANRSKAHTADDGKCDTCHGSLTEIGTSIANGRVPWETEPKCSDCHKFVAEVNTGANLYRNGTGHGGMSCPACHGPAHAQVPSSKDADNYQALQYQNKALSIGSCKVCHGTSRGGGINGVAVAHGSGQTTACNVCHTGSITTNNPAQFPHHFQQRNR